VPAGWNSGGRVHALDVTHTAALSHIVDVLRAAVGWGFDYLKLDFIYAGALAGRRHVETERHAAYRQAIEAIRAGVGDDVLLLACGAPVVPSLGVFDAIRVGPDVAYFRTRYCLLTDEQKALVADLTRVCRFRATSDIPATLDADEREALARYLDDRVARTAPLFDRRPRGRLRCRRRRGARAPADRRPTPMMSRWVGIAGRGRA
jgi:alpha-galactosidase